MTATSPLALVSLKLPLVLDELELTGPRHKEAAADAAADSTGVTRGAHERGIKFVSVWNDRRAASGEDMIEEREEGVNAAEDEEE